MTPPPILQAGALLLRPVATRDIDARFALGSDPRIVHMFGGDPNDTTPMTRDDARHWFEAMRSHPLAWVVQHDGALLGHVRLDALDEHDARANLAIGFFDFSKLGQKLGRQTIRLVLGHAFGTMRLHRIGVRVIAYNMRAIRCYAACGFVEEGRERQAALAGGVRHDDVMMGLLAHEFVYDSSLF